MACNYQGKIVTNGLVLCLDAADKKSYPGTGTVWTDRSGNGNNGTLTNGPTFSGANGGSLNFDGTNDHVFGSIPSSNFSGPHTICCWFYRRSVTQWSALFSNNTNTYSSSILTFINSTNSLGINQAGVNAASVSVDLGSDHLNKWIYGVVTYGGITSGSPINVYAYKNNSLLSSSGVLYWNMLSSSSYYVGRHYYEVTSLILDGLIPQVTLYNRVLTPQEIQQNFNATRGRFGI